MISDDQILAAYQEAGGNQAQAARSLAMAASTFKDRYKKARTNQVIKGRSQKRRAGIDSRNVLIIGDIHEPFALPGYRQFCEEQYKRYNCTHSIFIGDVIDFHFASYHETDPDGMSAGDELDAAIEKLKPWVRSFPISDVVFGNHDRMVMRKAFSGGIPQRWIRDYQDVLEAPGWRFADEFTYDGVQYVHGEGKTARNKAKGDLMSTVQGHRHPEAYCEFIVGKTFKIFGMQVGCGIDHKSYAMAYARNYPKPAIGCGVVLDHGKQPINLLMDL